MTTISCVEGEAVVIGDNLRITVLEIDGDQVVLQIDGPEDDVLLRQFEPEIAAAC